MVRGGRQAAAAAGAAAALLSVLHAHATSLGAGRQRVRGGAAVRSRLHRRPGAQLQVWRLYVSGCPLWQVRAVCRAPERQPGRSWRSISSDDSGLLCTGV